MRQLRSEKQATVELDGEAGMSSRVGVCVRACWHDQHYVVTAKGLGSGWDSALDRLFGTGLPGGQG